MGVSRPRWVGGFATEEEAKAARDEARVKARRGEYIDRNQITVTAYLEDWLDSSRDGDQAEDPAGLPGLHPALHHAAHRPHADPGRAAVHDHQAVPRPADQWRPPRQAARRHDRDSPARDAAESIPGCGHRRWLIGSNPVERAKRPRVQAREPGTVWTVAQLQAFLATARSTGCSPSSTSPPTPEPAAASCSTCAGPTSTSTSRRSPSADQPPWSAGERINGTTKSGRTRVVTIDDGTVAVLRQHKADQAAEQLLAGDSWRGTSDGYVFTTGWGEPIYPDTVSSLMTKLIRAHNEPEQGPDRRTSCRTPGCMICGISTPRLCCCPGAGACRRGPAGPRRPRDHPARVRPCDPHRRGRRGRHLRPGREHRIAGPQRAPLLAKALAKRPLP